MGRSPQNYAAKRSNYYIRMNMGSEIRSAVKESVLSYSLYHCVIVFIDTDVSEEPLPPGGHFFFVRFLFQFSLKRNRGY
jgi:hypothetical protein